MRKTGVETEQKTQLQEVSKEELSKYGWEYYLRIDGHVFTVLIEEGNDFGKALSENSRIYARHQLKSNTGRYLLPGSHIDILSKSKGEMSGKEIMITEYNPSIGHADFTVLTKMEKREGLGQKLSESLEAWQKNPREEVRIKNLNMAIATALNNGIDLVLKVPKEILNNTEPDSKAISESDVNRFAHFEEDKIVIEILSKLNKRVPYSKQFSLEVGLYRGHEQPYLIVKSRDVGSFGIFRPDEITTLELR